MINKNNNSNKLKLDQLKLQSFVTSIDREDQSRLKAGNSTLSFQLDDTHPKFFNGGSYLGKAV